MNNQVYRLRFHGFRDRELQALLLYLENQSEITQFVISEQDADVAIVDLDGPEHAAIWKKLKESFTGPVIALSVRERKYAASANYIPKPYHSDRLIEVIKILVEKPVADDSVVEPVSTNRIIDKAGRVNTDTPSSASDFHDVTEFDISQAAEIVMQEEKVADDGRANRKKNDLLVAQDSMPTPKAASKIWRADEDVQETDSTRRGGIESAEYSYMLSNDDYRSEDQGNRLYYQPADMLQGIVIDVLSTSRQTGRPALINGLGAPLYLCPLRGFVLTTISDQRLTALSRISISMDQLKISLLDEEQAEVLTLASQANKEPIATFLWRLTVLCARGRVPIGVSMERPVRLTIPPDLALPAMPGGETISRLWRAEAVSLRETPERLRIPYRDVFNFFSAAKVVGLIEDHPHSKKGLLGRLMGSIRA
jgi:hypothetical protein